ncbi:Uncharacterised protein [Mycobacteroides abscessus subsp. abscessus]|nr:Uncharacterised protein [Mycobacteroides abscessus subsp. abscessus]SKU58565.1 Uncharacterised protein [Mycobacteroides abscessus subsp. abscessus]
MEPTPALPGAMAAACTCGSAALRWATVSVTTTAAANERSGPMAMGAPAATRATICWAAGTADRLPAAASRGYSSGELPCAAGVPDAPFS